MTAGNDYSQKGTLAQIFRVAQTVGQAVLHHGKLMDLFNGKAFPALSGGMAAKIRSVSDTPLMTLKLEIGSGGHQDPADKRGVAHMLEHMMFSQHEDARNDLEREFLRRGGMRAGYTSPFGTLYEFSILDEGDNLDFMCGKVAKHIFDMKIDPAQLEAEKAVVLDELRMTTDMAGDNPGMLALKIAHGRDAHYHPVLGDKDSIAAMTVADLDEYRRKHYTAGNCSLTFSGPQNTLRMTQILEKYFGGISGAAPFSPERAAPPKPRSAEVRVEEPEKEQVRYGVALPVEVGDMKPPLSVQRVFSEYVHLALFEKTRGDENRYAYTQNVMLMTAPDSVPSLILQGSVGPEDANRVFKEFAAIMNDMVAGKIDEELLARAQGTCAHRLASGGRRNVLQDHVFHDMAVEAAQQKRLIAGLRQTGPDDMQAMAQLLDYNAVSMAVKGPLAGVVDVAGLKAHLPRRAQPDVAATLSGPPTRPVEAGQPIA